MCEEKIYGQEAYIPKKRQVRKHIISEKYFSASVSFTKFYKCRQMPEEDDMRLMIYEIFLKTHIRAHSHGFLKTTMKTIWMDN